MAPSVFTILVSQKPTENRTPLENFTTEGFVYLLRNSISKKTKLLPAFLNLLHLPFETAGSTYEIDTRREFKVRVGYSTKTVIPDITISKGGRIVCLIEVKVDSGIGQRTGSRGASTDQLKLYRRIRTEMEGGFPLYVLTKNPFYSDSVDDTYKLRWFQIAEMLSSIQRVGIVEDCLAPQFSDFLEEYGMKLHKVTDAAERGLNPIHDLLDQVYSVVNSITTTHKWKTIASNEELDYGWLGYGITTGTNRRIGWVGITFAETDSIVFSIEDEVLAKSVKGSSSSAFKDDGYEWGMIHADF